MADTASKRIDHSTANRDRFSTSSQEFEKNRHLAEEGIARPCLLALERHKSAQALAMTIARAVQKIYGCERTTIVQIESEAAKILALSDQVDIDSRRKLPLFLIQAIKEVALNDDSLVIYSDSASAELDARFPATKALYEHNGRCPVFAFMYPLRRVNSSSRSTATAQMRIGVLIENPNQKGFSRQTLKMMHSALTPVLNLLLLQLHTERHWMKRFVTKLKSVVCLDNYWHLTIKQSMLLLASILLLLGFVLRVPLQVNGLAVLHAKDSHVLTAPHTGFVSTSHIRAGDHVSQNQILASLDTRDLQLTAAKWNSESVKNKQAVDVALADRDRVALGKLRADAKRINAEMGLIEHRVARADIRAPFDGVVLSGDLSQLSGASVQQGDVLFTLASDAQYRLLLNVNENDVGLLKLHQTARIRMAAIPGRTFDAKIDEVLPMAVTIGESNFYQVPAVLEQKNDQLRPGMEGVVRITVGEGSFFSVYTRKLHESLKRILWRIGLIN